MPQYVAFLRAINLGARRTFPKNSIRACVESTGAVGVETHINTGNVLLRTTLRSRSRVEAALEEAFRQDRGFEVPTVVLTPLELSSVVTVGEELAGQHPAAVRHYVTLLKAEPSPEVAGELARLTPPGVTLRVVGRAVHVLPEQVLGQGGPRNDPIERLLGVATTRNHSVLRAIVQKWC
ncbi:MULTISPECIES: DUF1697 domain-containing protein [unclassified Ornithinimicrobium]|uniref:DUF1697 domain-containing protein n=1 Tax=unclassified Ornithinimicrobium TaxID=2615080 RepID=UPI0038529D50